VIQDQRVHNFSRLLDSAVSRRPDERIAARRPQYASAAIALLGTTVDAFSRWNQPVVSIKYSQLFVSPVSRQLADYAAVRRSQSTRAEKSLLGTANDAFSHWRQPNVPIIYSGLFDSAVF